MVKVYTVRPLSTYEAKAAYRIYAQDGNRITSRTTPGSSVYTTIGKMIEEDGDIIHIEKIADDWVTYTLAIAKGEVK